MSDKTKWFPASTNPKRQGVYERKYHWGVSFAYWDGRLWSLAEDTPDGAERWKNWKSGEVCQWRGLLKEPSPYRWPYNSKMQNVAKGGR